ncbi:type II toxin-antitoxin system VapC family toxin [Rhizobiaceae bacterium CRRU44]|uniref:Type II toxin-antitoxin system VapC family toxin n=1 Tax=Ferranicluibacter rubi TaxID=2715133 RepID=A0AA43ZIF6_9HYPH|nr:type II toxin-antitoxin system VapC family toxin [Ferranicluibacter rubi]NHT78254.1 type II toxin-antitoxin system VapC family toxin [Ferranicluibacter rubi]
MIGLDTNMVMRWLALGSITDAEGVKQGEQATAFLEQKIAPVFINHVVLVEVVWLLRQKVKMARPAVSAFIFDMLNRPRIVVQDRDAVIASLRFYELHPGDFSDHLIGEINSRNGCRTTYTFDRAAARSPLFSELSR